MTFDFVSHMLSDPSLYLALGPSPLPQRPALHRSAFHCLVLAIHNNGVFHSGPFDFHSPLRTFTSSTLVQDGGRRQPTEANKKETSSHHCAQSLRDRVSVPSGGASRSHAAGSRRGTPC